MSDLILHHYPQSPVAEKVRTALGVKGLDWCSVQIPRLPPKPDLMPLTGGYRRTPVMQIGANIYCDSQCILRALERRFPEPSFFPNHNQGLVWGISRWIDESVFSSILTVVIGSQIDTVDESFLNDRARLYFGPNWTRESIAREVPHAFAQLKTQFTWMNQQLNSEAAFMQGDQPGLADVLVYYITWLVRGRIEQGPEFLAQFQSLCEWEQRVLNLGHGRPEEMDSKRALEIALQAIPSIDLPEAKTSDLQGLKPGMQVSIIPDSDGGDPAVEGAIAAVNDSDIAILRENQQVGQVVIHFPRVGYRIEVLN